MLGTTLRVTTCVGEPSAGELYRRIMGVDSAMKRSMSIFDEGSLLSRLNRNETDSVDEHIVRNWTLAREIGALSGRPRRTSIRCSSSSAATRCRFATGGW